MSNETASGEMVEAPKMPATELLNEILAKSAYPAVIQKLAASGIGVESEEDLNKVVQTGQIIRHAIKQARASRGKFNIDQHMAKVASMLGLNPETPQADPAINSDMFAAAGL